MKQLPPVIQEKQILTDLKDFQQIALVSEFFDDLNMNKNFTILSSRVDGIQH